MQSGCIFNSWAFNENHKEAAFKFAKNLGCQENDPKEIIQYLKKIPAIDLLKGIKIGVCKLNLSIYFNQKLSF